jgi:hypothetical protein
LFVCGETISEKSGQTIPLKRSRERISITSFEAKSVIGPVFWLKRLWIRCGRSRM